MQRDFSDQTPFTPRQPSRLGPGVRSGFPKGTVSMPTSPLGRASSRWPEVPRTAQPFFNPSNHTPLDPFEPEWYEPLSTTDSFFPSSAAGPSSDADGEGDGDGDEDLFGRPRKKRAQVRVACTHCQKACKKCSNIRPCERCTKYGMRDCVDSTRKPRKTGIKRGPYRRRSSKYNLSPSVLPATRPPTQPNPAPGPPGPRTTALQGAFASALSGPRWVHGQRLPPRPPPPAHHVQPQPVYPANSNVPFPISLNHSGADPFSRAVSPIHGELDTGMQSGRGVAFGLNGESFETLLAGQGGMKPARDVPGGKGHEPGGGGTKQKMNGSRDLGHPVFATQETFKRAQTPTYDPDPNLDYSQIFSAPVTPHPQDGGTSTTDWTDLHTAADLHRSSGVSPLDHLSHVQTQLEQIFASPPHPHHNSDPAHLHPHPPPHPHVQTGQTGESNTAAATGFIPLNKIRKPSLRTLLSTGGSQAPSPVQSPTLFNQPMQMDEELPAGTVVDGGHGQQWDDGMVVGQVGFGGAQQAGWEGMGFSGFEGMIPFQT